MKMIATGMLRGGYPTPDRRPVVDRLRRVLAEAELDCGCRSAADAMLVRFGVEQDLARRAEALADARAMRDGIVAVLDLLAELDDIRPEEPDGSAFDEISDLFRDITDLATRGATAAGRAARKGDE